MKTRLEQVLERCLNGREVAVWGTPTRRLLRVLKPYKFHVAGSVDPGNHYVVAVNDDDLSDFLSDETSKQCKFAYDYLTFNDEGGELPFERMCFDVPVGRQTYFGEGGRRRLQKRLYQKHRSVYLYQRNRKNSC